MTGRRPVNGALPMCPTSGICRAMSVRTRSPCRNCAHTNVSLQTHLSRIGTPKELLRHVHDTCSECVDLLERLIDARQADQSNPPWSNIVLDIYALFGGGNVSDTYLASKPLTGKRPGDTAHARLLLETLNLTCRKFNVGSQSCVYLEDILYCKRHIPALTMYKLESMIRKYRKRKCSLKEIRTAILDHEKRQKIPKDIPLRKRFNQELPKQ